jgi:N6-L-threonylcarbamoyladenine synthase
LTADRVADIAASFQEAVVDVLVAKCRQALHQQNRKTLCVGGGVAANARLREKLKQLAEDEGIELIIAPLAYCTDNAAMGAIAWERLEAGQFADLTLDVTPGLVRLP